jgi:hypothetical protein
MRVRLGALEHWNASIDKKPRGCVTGEVVPLLRLLMSPLMRICTMCGRLAPEPEIRAGPAGKCFECDKQYEREKSRRRRATSHAVRARDWLAWQQARAQARARDSGCVYRSQGGCSRNSPSTISFRSSKAEAAPTRSRNSSPSAAHATNVCSTDNALGLGVRSA